MDSNITLLYTPLGFYCNKKGSPLSEDVEGTSLGGLRDAILN